MYYVGPHIRELIVSAEVKKLERRQAAERARRSATRRSSPGCDEAGAAPLELGRRGPAGGRRAD